jgi:hypothetical protein
VTAKDMIEKTARHFGVPAVLIEAIVRAEGGDRAFVRGIALTIPTCHTFEEALEIACRTVAHAACDFALLAAPQFIAFLGGRWAPVGAKNDPNHLNENWVPNVLNAYAVLVHHPSLMPVDLDNLSREV